MSNVSHDEIVTLRAAGHLAASTDLVLCSTAADVAVICVPDSADK